MKRITSICVLFLLVNFSQAQDHSADSLRAVLKTKISDTARVMTCVRLAKALEFTNYDEGMNYLKKGLALGKKIKYAHGLGRIYLYYGFYLEDKAQYIEAFSYYKKSKAVLKKTRYKQDMEQAILGMSNCYRLQGDFANALKLAFEAYKIDEAIHSKVGIMQASGRIGTIYCELGNTKMAYNYFHKQLVLAKQTGKTNYLSAATCNVANVYLLEKKFTLALNYYMRSLDLDTKNNDHYGMAVDYNNIANVHESLADSALNLGNKKMYNQLLLKAVEFCQKAVDLDRGENDVLGLTLHTASLGRISAYINRFAEGERLLNESLALATNSGDIYSIYHAHQGLMELYSQQGNYKKTLEQMHLKAQYGDSIFNAEKNDEITRHQLNYEFEKKEAKINAINQKKDALRKAGKQQQLLLLILVAFVALAIAIITLIIFRSLKTTRKQKAYIEEQKHIVEEKQKEIMDSILYAKRIQQALLPSEKYISRVIKSNNNK